MKKFTKMAGVTLLEVMLVLAVAAMIIVMSIRYYQSATTGQQVTGALNLLQGIQANMDGMAQGTGSYQDVTITDMEKLMPAGSVRTPWGTDATIAADSATQFTVGLPSTPEAVCLQLNARMQSNQKWTTPTCSAGANSYSISYSSVGG